MHVLHIYRTYYPDSTGGIQEAIRQIALATKAEAITSTILSLSPAPFPAILEMPEGTVVRCRSWGAPASCDLGGPDSLKSFNELARLADVIVYHFPWPFADILSLLSSTEKPSVVVYHSDIVRQRFLGYLYRPLMWRTLKFVSTLVATSSTYASTSVVLSSPNVRNKVRVIPLGIDEYSYPSQGDNAIFTRLDLQAGEPYFLFLGVLRHYKGVTYLLEAAKNVGARIVIAGVGSEHKRLVRRAKSLGLENVLFAGHISNAEKISLLARCRALVLPSHLRSEAFGMVLIEAAMLGKPSITCEIGTGTSYVNAHGESGLVVPPKNPPALADAMNALLSDSRLTENLALGARNRYERLFSGPALGSAWSEFLRELKGR